MLASVAVTVYIDYGITSPNVAAGIEEFTDVTND